MKRNHPVLTYAVVAAASLFFAGLSSSWTDQKDMDTGTWLALKTAVLPQ
jgi:hypothetical protein